MIRDRLIDTVESLHLDGPIRTARSRIVPAYRGQQHERTKLRRLLSAHLGAASNCVDIGAYRGRMLDEMLRVAPKGRHIAYEPNDEMYARLVRRYPGVDARRAACGDHTGETTFTVVADSPGLSGFRDRWHGAEHRTRQVTVQVVTLDTDLPAAYVPHFIKIDVEGAELQVFQGAVRTLSVHKPLVMFEHGKGGAEHYGTSPGDIHTILVSTCGLRLFDFDGNGPYSEQQFNDAFETNARWDFIARA
jgi:FkbM family methyltransferase